MSTEGNNTKRRDWVKNVTIVFLAGMLVLTFFSNTIMNYSLPEVATQYVQYGTIVSKIRGSGTVESGDPYHVQINETRKVESVLVQVGAEVQKGDPMFILAEGSSTEVKDAQAQLDAMVLDFEMQILSGSISSEAINNVQSGKVSSVDGYQAKLVAADAEIDKWQAEVDYAQSQIDYLTGVQGQISGAVPDTTAEEAAVATAEANLAASAVAVANQRIAQLDDLIAACDQVIFDYNQKIIVRYDKQEVSGGNPIYTPIYQVSDEEYMVAANNRTNYLNQRATQTAIVNDGTNKANYDALVKALAQARQNLTNKANSVANNTASINTQLNNWRLELNARSKNLENANRNKSQLLADISAELNLSSKLDAINAKKKEIAALREKASGMTVEAPISGKITNVNVFAGQQTTPGSPMASMQPEGSGMTMSLTVTNEQARRLNVGMMAELVNSWRYDDVTVTLSRIQPDPSNPSQNKKLVFDVTGNDVMAGQNLNISVGDKSAEYDLTVPNSAVREDNNGKFILIVEVKASPLGNRYKATRVDVEVIASDDLRSALRCELNGYEYVITTATKPVTAGQLVRLADSQ